MNESPTFQIPRDVIEPIIQAHVASAVIAALGSGNQMIEAAVARILNEKVDSEGRSTSSDYQSTTWIIHVMRKQLREAIAATVAEEMPKHKEAIRRLIARELKKDNSPMLKQFVDGMTAAIVSPDTLKYRFTVAYETDADRRNR
jgi:hypothetical protein